MNCKMDVDVINLLRIDFGLAKDTKITEIMPGSCCNVFNVTYYTIFRFGQLLVLGLILTAKAVNLTFFGL